MLRRAARSAWGAALHPRGSPATHGFASALHALPCVTALPLSGGYAVTGCVRAVTGRSSQPLAGFAARGLHTAQPAPSAADTTDDVAAQRDLLRVQAEQLHAATTKLRAVLEELDQLPGLKAASERELEAEATALADQQRRANGRVRLFTWLGLAGLVAHWAAFARLTYWELSWDVMEPAAFLVSQLWVVVAYVYFMFTREDYSYVDAEKRVRNTVMRAARAARR